MNPVHFPPIPARSRTQFLSGITEARKSIDPGKYKSIYVTYLFIFFIERRRIEIKYFKAWRFDEKFIFFFGFFLEE